MQIAQYNSNFEMKQTVEKVYFAFVTFVNRPTLFENLEQLLEVDGLITELYDQYADNIGEFKNVDDDPEKCK